MINTRQAQEAILANCLGYDSALVVDETVSTLDAFDFEKDLREIYIAIADIHKSGKPVDIISVSNIFDNKKDSKINTVFLAELMDRSVSASNHSHHCEIVREHGSRRRLREKLNSAIANLDDPDQAFKEITENIDRELMRTVNRSKKLFVRGDEAAAGAMDKLQWYHDHPGELSGLDTGFKYLNQLTLGMQQGHMVMLAARPSMGKTALALCMIRQFIKAGKKVYFLSLEASPENLMNRMICQEAGVSNYYARQGKLNQFDWQKISSNIQNLAKTNLIIDDSSQATEVDLLSKARMLKRTEGLDCIVIDYIQLMRSGKRFENKNIEMSNISNVIKNDIARGLDVCVLALSQLSRDVERRGNPRPTLSDLRDSGALEQDADEIIFLDRPERRGSTEIKVAENLTIPAENKAQVWLDKQKDGPTGNFILNFDPESMRFSDWHKQEDEIPLPEPNF